MSREKAPAASECLAYSIYLPLCCCCCCFGERERGALMDCTRLLRTQTMASLSSPTTIGCISNLIEATECIYNTHSRESWVVVFFSLFFFYSAKTFEWKCCTLRRYKYKIHTAQPTLFFYFRFFFPLVYPRSEGLGLSLSLIDSTCMEGHSLAILTLSRCCCCCCCPRAKGAFRLPNIFFGSRFFIFSPSFQRDGLDSSSYFVFSSTVHWLK